MTAVATAISPKELRKESIEIRAACKTIRRSKKTATAFLVKHGFITKAGKLTKRYGG